MSAAPSFKQRVAKAVAEAGGQLRLALSWRLTRTPDTRPSAGSLREAAASSLGMSAGSFWPSPSRVTMVSPLAASTPLRMARLCPRLRAWRSGRKCAISLFSRVSSSAVRIARAVIHENDFMIGLALERGRDLAGQRGDIFRLVLDRHHHRDRHRLQRISQNPGAWLDWHAVGAAPIGPRLIQSGRSGNNI